MRSSTEKSNRTCSFCGQDKTDNGTPDLRIEIAMPGTDENFITWSHENCFTKLQNNTVLPDKPEEYGSIPPNARCVFCGEKLPLIGSHPYCFDVGLQESPVRYWAHKECMVEIVKDLQLK